MSWRQAKDRIMALQHTQKSAWAQWDDITALEQTSYWRGMGVHEEDATYEVVTYDALRAAQQPPVNEPVWSPKERLARLRAEKRYREKRKAELDARTTREKVDKCRTTIWRRRVEQAANGPELYAIYVNTLNVWLDYQWTPKQQRRLHTELSRRRTAERHRQLQERQKAAAIADEPPGLQVIIKPVIVVARPPKTFELRRPTSVLPKPLPERFYAPTETELWKGRRRRKLRPCAPKYVGLTRSQAETAHGRMLRGETEPDFFLGYDDCE